MSEDQDDAYSEARAEIERLKAENVRLERDLATVRSFFRYQAAASQKFLALATELADALAAEVCDDYGEIPARHLDLLNRARGTRVSKSPEQTVAAEILEITQTYHEQEESGHVDTPGGLEHMGDVWELLVRWEKMLLATPAPDISAGSRPD